MKKPFVIGIAGGSACGKTTFTAALSKSLSGRGAGVLEIHMDSYFKDKKDRPSAQSPVSGVTYMDDNHPLTADLPKLAADLDNAIADGSADIILIEGLLTLWDEHIYSKLGLRIFIDCKPDERIVRRLRRNMGRGLAFDEIAAVYLDLVRFRHDEYVEPTKWRADIILNGSIPSDAALEMISEYALNRINPAPRP